MADSYSPIVPATPQLSGLSLRCAVAASESPIGSFVFNQMLKYRVPRMLQVGPCRRYCCPTCHVCTQSSSLIALFSLAIDSTGIQIRRRCEVGVVGGLLQSFPSYSSSSTSCQQQHQLSAAAPAVSSSISCQQQHRLSMDT